MPCAVAPDTTPWGTHAYIISAGLAERMARVGDWMLNRAKLGVNDKSAWELDGDDINSDHFLRNYYEQLISVEERQRCVPH